MKDKTKTTTIEAAGFHLGNGGLNLSVTEHEYEYELNEDSPSRTLTSYMMGVSLNHHGAEVHFEFPLGSLEVVGWLHEMTGRLVKRMATKNRGGRNYTFDYVKHGSATVEDGKEVDYSFRWKDDEAGIGTLLAGSPGPGLIKYSPELNVTTIDGMMQKQDDVPAK